VAAAIGGLLRDPDRAKAMGAAGRAWVQRDWTWEVAAQRLSAMLRVAG